MNYLFENYSIIICVLKESFKNYFFKLILAVVFLICFGCSDNDIPDESQGKGFLFVPSLSLEVETEGFSKKNNSVKNTTGNNIADFVVEVLSYPEEEIVIHYENYSEISDEGKIALEAGNYILRVYNDNFPEVSPAFDFPYFFGQSPVFSIEYEETTEIEDLVITAKNSKVTVNFSDTIATQFDDYQMKITTSENNNSLVFSRSETRSGFFTSSYDLTLLGTFSFTRNDGTIDTRTINHTINDIQSGTAYIINVNVTLEDGVLVFNLILDDSFDEEIIDLGNGDVDDNTFVPKEKPIITSVLNTFESNSTQTYMLIWETVEEATHYTVFTGSNLGTLTEYATNVSNTTIAINLIEGANFFKVIAHFEDGETTAYLGGNFRKYEEIGTVNSLNELSPINEETYNSTQTNIINGNNVLFQANDNTNTTTAVRLHLNGDSNGDQIDLTASGIAEQINNGDGGMKYYYYSSKQDGFLARNNNEYNYYTAIINPINELNLSQYNDPVLAVEIDIVGINWSIGTPYFYIEKREAGIGTWENINNGWHTTSSIFDYDIEKGKTYEYRFKINNTKDFVRASNYSQVKSIVVE